MELKWELGLLQPHNVTHRKIIKMQSFKHPRMISLQLQGLPVSQFQLLNPIIIKKRTPGFFKNCSIVDLNTELE